MYDRKLGRDLLYLSNRSSTEDSQLENVRCITTLARNRDDLRAAPADTLAARLLRLDSVRGSTLIAPRAPMPLRPCWRQIDGSPREILARRSVPRPHRASSVRR